MTLYKAINAAREAAIRIDADLDELLEAIPRKAYDDYGSIVGAAKSDLQTLAALPDQPKSEDELLLIVKKHVKGMANPETVRATIQALKAANVLFVKED